MTLPDLCASVWSLSALRVAAESDLLAALASGVRDPHALATAAALDPAVTIRILETLEQSGFVARAPGEAAAFSLTDEGASLARRPDWLRADLAATFTQSSAFVTESRTSDLGGGWNHADLEAIRAQSRLSQILTHGMLEPLFTAVPALAVSLGRAGAVFLDAGSGAAGVAMTFCRRFPELRAVAIDPLRGARLEARSALGLAGLGNRVDVRADRVEDLTEENVYAAAFVACAFMSDPSLQAGLERIRRALVPGGVVLLSGVEAPADPRLAAVSRLRWQLWGGAGRSPDAVVRLAEQAGLARVERGPAQGSLVPVIARKPG